VEEKKSPWNNIMSLKMIDFGIANKFRHGRNRRNSREFEAREVLTGLRGLTPADAKKRLNLTTERTLFCKSPEQLGFGTSDTNEMKVDVWALGVISYFLLSGQPPFQSAQGSTDAALFRSATFVFMPPELWRPISSEAKNFIAMCLQKEPEHRPDASKVMNLPWMVTARRAIDEMTASSSGSDHHRNGNSLAIVPSPSAGAGVGLGVPESILPSAKRTAKNLDRMSRLHVLEKAAIIAAAHRLSPPKLEEFKGALQLRDKTGSISVYHLFEELEATGVPCADLSKLVKDLDVGGTVTIEYDVFCSDVAEFQQNLQDSAVWAVFRSFETNGAPPHMTKKELTVVLGEDNLRQGIADNFPELALDSVLQELDHDAQGVIDFEEFKTILKMPAKSTLAPAPRTASSDSTQYSTSREPTS
jgi:Ca2+-binding EF-hand superfamily protein